MMFYICIDNEGQIFDCVTTLRLAKDIVGGAGGGEINAVEVPVTPETICRLLGNIGGYATQCRTIEVAA